MADEIILQRFDGAMPVAIERFNGTLVVPVSAIAYSYTCGHVQEDGHSFEDLRVVVIPSRGEHKVLLCADCNAKLRARMPLRIAANAQTAGGK